MNQFKIIIILLISALPWTAFAQSGISGGVFDQENKNMPLQKVRVRNLTKEVITETGAAGQFNIRADKGDLLEFYLAGYHTDTLYLTSLQSKTIYLPPFSNDLRQVDVKSARISKDLDLKNVGQGEAFKRISGIAPKQNIGRAGGIGLAFGSGKIKRDKIKAAALEERSYFEAEINHYFNEEFIGEMLNLKGQELLDFINYYRPVVAKVKAEQPFNYEYYIAQAYQSWMRLPPEQRKSPPMQKLVK